MPRVPICKACPPGSAGRPPAPLADLLPFPLQMHTGSTPLAQDAALPAGKPRDLLLGHASKGVNNSVLSDVHVSATRVRPTRVACTSTHLLVVHSAPALMYARRRPARPISTCLCGEGRTDNSVQPPDERPKLEVRLLFDFELTSLCHRVRPSPTMDRDRPGAHS